MSDFWNFSRVASQYGQVADIYQEAENVQYKRDSILASDWHEVNLQKSLNGLKSQLSGMAPEKQKEFFDNGGLDKWKQSVQKLSLNSPFRDTLEVRTEGYLLEQAPLLEKMRQGAVDGDFLTKFSQIGQDYLDKGDIAGYDAKLSEYAKAGIGSEALKQAYGLKTSWAENRLNQGALSGRGWQYILGDVGPPPVAPTPPKDLSIAPEYVQKAALADYQNQMNAYNAKLTEYKKDVEAVNMIDPERKHKLAGEARTTLEAMEKDGRDARKEQLDLIIGQIQNNLAEGKRTSASNLYNEAVSRGVFNAFADESHKVKGWIDDANKPAAGGGTGGQEKAGNEWMKDFYLKIATVNRDQVSDTDLRNMVMQNIGNITADQLKSALAAVDSRDNFAIGSDKLATATALLKNKIAVMKNIKAEKVDEGEINQALKIYAGALIKARQTNKSLTANQEAEILNKSFSAYQKQADLTNQKPQVIGANLGIRELAGTNEYKTFMTNREALVTGYNSGSKDYKDAYSQLEQSVKQSLSNNFKKGDFTNRAYTTYLDIGNPQSGSMGPIQSQAFGPEAYGKPLIMVPISPKAGVKSPNIRGAQKNPVYYENGQQKQFNGLGLYMLPPTTAGERTKIWDNEKKEWFDAESISMTFEQGK